MVCTYLSSVHTIRVCNFSDIARPIGPAQEGYSSGAYYRTSPKMGAVHSRIDALVNKDWRALAAYADIPSDYYRRLWNPTIDEFADQSQKRKTIAIDSRQSMHERTTKAKNPASKPRLTKATPVPAQKLSSDDIRSKEYQDKLIRELSQASGLGTT